MNVDLVYASIFAARPELMGADKLQRVYVIGMDRLDQCGASVRELHHSCSKGPRPAIGVHLGAKLIPPPSGGATNIVHKPDVVARAQQGTWAV